MKKIKITENDMRLLMMLSALLLLVASYFLFYKPNLSKAEQIRTSNEEKELQVKELQGMLLHKQEEEKRIEQMRLEIEEIRTAFPARVTEEKAIYLMNEMEKASGIELTNLSFQMENPYFTGEEVAITGLVSQISLSFDKASYSGIKKATEFINASLDRMTVESLSLSYNQMENTLSGSMTVNMYAMQGTGREYEPPVILGVSKGVKNLFRNGN